MKTTGVGLRDSVDPVRRIRLAEEVGVSGEEASTEIQTPMSRGVRYQYSKKSVTARHSDPVLVVSERRQLDRKGEQLPFPFRYNSDQVG